MKIFINILLLSLITGTNMFLCMETSACAEVVSKNKVLECNKEIEQFLCCYIHSLVFSSYDKDSLKGSLLVGSEHSRPVLLWDASINNQKEFEGPHVSYINKIALSADGKKALSAPSRNIIALFWDLYKGTFKALRGHLGLISSLALSSNGERALTGSYDRTAILWDTTTEKPIKIFTKLRNYVTATALSFDGKIALVCYEDGTVSCWDADWGAERKEPEILGRHENMVFSASLSFDGKIALTAGSWRDTACLWSITDGKKLCELKGPTRFITSVALNTDASLALTGYSNGEVCLWDVKTGNLLKVLKVDLSMWRASVSSVAFSQKGNRFAVSLCNGPVSIWCYDYAVDSEQLEEKNLTSSKKEEEEKSFIKEISYELLSPYVGGTTQATTAITQTTPVGQNQSENEVNLDNTIETQTECSVQ